MNVPGSFPPPIANDKFSIPNFQCQFIRVHRCSFVVAKDSFPSARVRRLFAPIGIPSQNLSIHALQNFHRRLPVAPFPPMILLRGECMKACIPTRAGRDATDPVEAGSGQFRIAMAPHSTPLSRGRRANRRRKSEASSNQSLPSSIAAPVKPPLNSVNVGQSWFNKDKNKKSAPLPLSSLSGNWCSFVSIRGSLPSRISQAAFFVWRTAVGSRRAGRQLPMTILTAQFSTFRVSQLHRNSTATNCNHLRQVALTCTYLRQVALFALKKIWWEGKITISPPTVRRG